METSQPACVRRLGSSAPDAVAGYLADQDLVVSSRRVYTLTWTG